MQYIIKTKKGDDSSSIIKIEEKIDEESEFGSDA